MYTVRESWFLGGVTSVAGEPITYGKTMSFEYKLETSPRFILDMFMLERVEEYIKGENMNTAYEVFIR